ncbi:MAG: 3',5'-cyclic adenosine monophosphate phosphodiesterase CpdA [Ardenticatenaceae bacterium]|nr:MAG: 3',5'-cyclic adenosine monophosphate phosphodiesterase CpdA [Ardenticatenaceae bacterium]
MHMHEPTEAVYFVHLSDSHIGPTAEYSRHGYRSQPCVERAVEIINSLPTLPDFVIHTGDVVTEPDVRSYERAAEIFGQLNVPIYFSTGNHDRARDIRRYLEMGPRNDFSTNADDLSYAFEVKGYRFLVLDARGPDEIDPHGVLSDAQMEIVRAEAIGEGPPLTVFLHFPVLPLNSIWMDAYMLVINGEQLHQALLPAKDRLRGVFYGHIHHSMQTFRDGILYTAVPSLFSQFAAWPNDTIVRDDPDALPGFNFVHLLPDKTIVHQHTFPRP